MDVLAITPGLVQFLKELFNLDGKAVTVLSFVVGILLTVAFNLEQFFPDIGVYVEFATKALTGGLAASGYYKLYKQAKQAIGPKKT